MRVFYRAYRGFLRPRRSYPTNRISYLSVKVVREGYENGSGFSLNWGYEFRHFVLVNGLENTDHKVR